MNSTPIKAAVLILKHHGVPVCIVGELALNYYNVPRVCHVSLSCSSAGLWGLTRRKDLEICVPEASSLVAADLLCSTGLFEPLEQDKEFNNYTEYKRGFPRVRTTSWTHPLQTTVIFPATFFGLDPIEKVLVPPFADRSIYFSKEITNLGAQDIAALPLPRLAPLLRGLAKRYLDTKDDVSMIAVEQLVDGMNLDAAWAESNLEGSEVALLDLVTDQIDGKKSRIDYFSDNKVTCFISDEDEAKNVRFIPGFE